MKYRTKPLVKEAIQFTGSNCFQIMHFMNRSRDISDCDLNDTDWPIINTLEGDLACSPGDYIVKGINGEFYPVKPDIFEKSYEPVGDDES